MTRKILGAVVVAILAATAGRSADAPAVGEVWRCAGTSDGPPVTFQVQRIDAASELGRTAAEGGVAHVTAWIEGAPQAPRLGHAPFEEAALVKCDPALVAADAAPQPGFDESYRRWRAAFDAGQVGVFTASVPETYLAMATAHSRRGQ